MKIPHITIKQAQAIYPLDIEDMLEEWLPLLNDRIDRYNEAEAEQSEYITAEQARVLGAGNAEYRYRGSQWGDWITCQTAYESSTPTWEVQYRATKQTKPSDPHAELKAQYEQQVKDGTLGDFVWEEKSKIQTVWHSLSEPNTPHFLSKFDYKCTSKPTCQVQLIGGEVQTMTREKAKALQADTTETHDWGVGSQWFIGGRLSYEFTDNCVYKYRPKQNIVKLDGELMSREAAIAKYEAVKTTVDIYANHGAQGWKFTDSPAFWLDGSHGTSSEYQLRPKAKKVISWADIPVGVMTNKGELRGTYVGTSRNGLADIERQEIKGFGKDLRSEYLRDLTLAPASKQPWLNWRGGECPVPEGVIVEITRRDCSVVKKLAQGCVWKHEEEEGYDIIEYRIVGIESGYVLGGN